MVGSKNITKCRLPKDADAVTKELYSELKEQLTDAHNEKTVKKQRRQEGEVSNLAATICGWGGGEYSGRKWGVPDHQILRQGDKRRG